METKKQSSGKLPGMNVEMDAAGKAAVRIREANTKISEGKSSREIAEKELVEILQSTNRLRIKVDDRLYEIDHKDAKDKIRVIVDKDE